MILLFLSTVTYAQWPLESYIVQTTREDNEVILGLLRSSELDEALTYGKLLGRRRDAYLGDILSGLVSDHAGTDALRTETLLRTILESVFFDSGGRVKEQARRLNRAALGSLQEQITGFSDSRLRALLLYLLPPDPRGRDLKTLLRYGRACLEFAKEKGGRFPGEYPVEVFAFLDVTGRTDSLQVEAIVRELYHLSMDDTITAAAGETLRKIREKSAD